MSSVKLPVTCDCGHTCVIDARGVDEDTNIPCPACKADFHLELETIDAIHADYTDQITLAVEDDDLANRLIESFIEASPVKRATVVDSGR